MPTPRPPTVLMTNDDGPPSSSSPNIYGFVKLLREKLGWEVKVVIPDCQKSWVGKAYAISDVIEARYFYPRGPDGLTGDVCLKSRPLKEGEDMEWIMLTGTPATCSNIGLFNLYPGEIDLVISGPNHGKNASAAFALSSGTLGAALSSTLSSVRSIGLSYGVIQRPVPEPARTLANEISVDIISRLWNDWGVDEDYRQEFGHAPGEGKIKGQVGMYAINVPLKEEWLSKENRKVYWTRMWRNGYSRLFKVQEVGAAKPGKEDWASKPSGASTPIPAAAGPAAVPEQKQRAPEPEDIWELMKKERGEKAVAVAADGEDAPLRFVFEPSMKAMAFPEEELMAKGTDMWAMHHGYCSVTPLQASFAEPGIRSMGLGSEPFTGDVDELNGSHQWIL